MVPWGWGLQKWRGGGFSLTHVGPQAAHFSSYSCLSSKGCHQPTALWACCQAAAAGEGDIIHPGDKAADERWAPPAAVPSQRGWSGCERYTGMWGEGDHFEIKNNGFDLEWQESTLQIGDRS